MKILLAIIVILALWTLWGYYSSKVEQAEYTVLEKRDGYEIREYPAHIVAQTTIKGNYDAALNEGFSIVAGYIFGGNVKKQGIAMTAPVTSEQGVPEKIAMTAPVQAMEEGDARIISFVMPKSYTMDTLPTPTDSRVKIVQVPPKKVAVIRFSWFRSSDRIKEKEADLLAALTRDEVQVIGGLTYAGYNAPWTPPWMTRNEVMVEVR